MKKWGQIALCLYFLRGMNVRKRGIFLGKGGETSRARREAVPWEGIGNIVRLLGICGFNCYAGGTGKSRNVDFQGQGY